jgi:hypothetical protein
MKNNHNESNGAGAPIAFANPSPRSGVSLPLGNHPNNTGGKTGRSGGIPNAFKAFVRSIRDDPKARQALVDAAQDPNSRNFGIAWKIATDYDDEKPAQKKELSGRVEMTVRIVREGQRPTVRESLALVG